MMIDAIGRSVLVIGNIDPSSIAYAALAPIKSAATPILVRSRRDAAENIHAVSAHRAKITVSWQPSGEILFYTLGLSHCSFIAERNALLLVESQIG